MSAPFPVERTAWRAGAHKLQLVSASSGTDDPRHRILNVVVALIGILVTLVPMLLLALLVKLTSRGPVFYKQTRVGLDRRNLFATQEALRRNRDVGGRPFAMYKFRTMCADSGSVQVWARSDDTRITAVGRVLRMYRLDELPQLFNVLRGEMNVVGPRPEQPDLFVDLRQQIHRYPARQRVLPGITGWAQVNQAYDSSLDDVRRKLHYDLEYISRRTPMEDLKIMVLTVPVMLGKRGAW